MSNHGNSTRADAKVAIVIPCHNEVAYLSEAIESARKQTYGNIEIILVEDHPTNESASAGIAALARKADKHLRHEANLGVSAARNTGIRNTDAEYILPLDSDDVIGPEYVSLAVHELRQNAQLGLVYCRAQFFGAKTGLWNLPDFQLDSFLFENCIFSSAVYRRKVWEEVGGYDETLLRTSEDWDFWIRVIGRGYSVRRLNEVLFFYRQYEGSRNAESLRHGLDGRRMMFDRHPDLYYASYVRLAVAHLGSPTDQMRARIARLLKGIGARLLPR